MRFLRARREHHADNGGDAEDVQLAAHVPAVPGGAMAGSQAPPSGSGLDLPGSADELASGVSRRKFLVGTGLAVGAGVTLSGIACRRPRGEAAPLAPVAPTAGTSWSEVRRQFDLAPGLVHMSGFFLASHPRLVADAIAKHRRGLDENPFHYIEDNLARLETAVREVASAYLGARPDELAMTDSTTMGLGLVYGGMKLRPGQEILTDTHDHIVTTLSLQYAAARTGATLRQVPLYSAPAEANAERIVETVARNLRPATRLVALTWVHSGTGVKLPVRQIAEAMAKFNAGRAPEDRALLSIDAVHGLGLEEVTVGDLGCDFFIAGCHKWLFGPRGTGLVWARPGAWAATGPTIPSFDPMWRSGPPQAMPPAAFNTPGGFHSFEHRWALAEAFRFHLGLGKARVAARVHDLNRRCKEGLARLSRVKVRTPLSADLSAGIICFEVDGLSPAEVVARLRARSVVASVTPDFYVPPYARVAPSLLTNEDEVDATVRAIAEL
jgi:isopenicillin-N epimerase